MSNAFDPPDINVLRLCRAWDYQFHFRGSFQLDVPRTIVTLRGR